MLYTLPISAFLLELVLLREVFKIFELDFDLKLVALVYKSPLIFRFIITGEDSFFNFFTDFFLELVEFDRLLFLKADCFRFGVRERDDFIVLVVD